MYNEILTSLLRTVSHNIDLVTLFKGEWGKAEKKKAFWKAKNLLDVYAVVLVLFY